jgi:hypothetical protein
MALNSKGTVDKQNASYQKRALTGEEILDEVVFSMNVFFFVFFTTLAGLGYFSIWLIAGFWLLYMTLLLLILCLPRAETRPPVRLTSFQRNRQGIDRAGNSPAQRLAASASQPYLNPEGTSGKNAPLVSLRA